MLNQRLIFIPYKSHGSAVGLAVDFRLNYRGVALEAPIVSGIVTCAHLPGGSHIQWVPKVKATWASSAEVKKTWILTSTPPIRLHGAVFN
jgi:hypothetical protein